MVKPVLRRVIMAAFLVADVSSMAAPAAAQSVCDSRKSLIDALESKYAETRRAKGIVSDNNVLELFVSENGSWSLMVTSPTGRSCVVGAGQSWQDMPEGKKLSELDF